MDALETYLRPPRHSAHRYRSIAPCRCEDVRFQNKSNVGSLSGTDWEKGETRMTSGRDGAPACSPGLYSRVMFSIAAVADADLIYLAHPKKRLILVEWLVVLVRPR
jgi:hypothetical protein